MAINDKVIYLMRLMAEHGFVTAKEVELLYNYRMVAYRCFKALNEIKFIDSFETQLNPKTAYCLTDAGYKFLESTGKLRIIKRFFKSDYRPTQFSHTISGLQARIILRKHPDVIDYRTEKVVAYYQSLNDWNEVMRKRAKQCDAELIFKTRNGEYKVGVEIELTAKSFKRLVGAVQSIDENREDLYVVLWIASDEVIIRDLQRVINRLLPHLRYPKKHLFIVWNELKSRQLDALWSNVHGQKTKLFG